jgi:hypothetical protein
MAQEFFDGHRSICCYMKQHTATIDVPKAHHHSLSDNGIVGNLAKAACQSILVSLH